jgi:hypothetical protein
MGSDAMIYIPSFIKIGSGIQNLTEVIHTRTQRQYGNLISLFLFFKKNNEIRVIIIMLKL